MIKINIEKDNKFEIRMSGDTKTVLAEFAAMVEHVRESFESNDSGDIFKVAVMSAVLDIPIEIIDKAYKTSFKDFHKKNSSKNVKGGDNK